MAKRKKDPYRRFAESFVGKKETTVLIIAVLAALLAGNYVYLNYFSEPESSAVAMGTEEKIVASEVNYFEDANGYFVRPAEDGNYPALILIHEWWGLNDNIKKLSRDFAEEGYVVLAVDMYGGRSADEPDGARELATEVRNDMDGAFENLDAAVSYLKASEYVEDEKLASVGWCFGGGWSYEMARNDLGVDASVIYYGRFNPEDDLSIMRANIMGHFGEEDASILVDDVREFEATLQTHSGDHQIFIYPNAGHAFANDDSMAYVPEAAELSWTRTTEFLERQLK